MRRNDAQNQSKFMQIVTIPARLLSKARDFYVRSLTEYSQSAPSSSRQVPALRRSVSAASLRPGIGDGDDYRELIRAASVRSQGHRNEFDMLIKGSRGLPRSCSVGLRKIDEDKSLEVGDGEETVIKQKKKKVDLLYPRSRSHSVSKGLF